MESAMLFIRSENVKSQNKRIDFPDPSFQTISTCRLSLVLKSQGTSFHNVIIAVPELHLNSYVSRGFIALRFASSCTISAFSALYKIGDRVPPLWGTLLKSLNSVTRLVASKLCNGCHDCNR